MSAPLRPIEVPPFQLQPLISSVPAPAKPVNHGHKTSHSGEFDFLRNTEGTLSNLASRVMGGASASATRSTQADIVKPSSGREITCVEAFNKDIYIGCSDGTLIRYSVRDDEGVSGDAYTVASLQSVPGAKAVEKIALIPPLSKAMVLSGGIVHFYTLPAFDPVPAATISPLRSVVSFAVDETAVRLSNNHVPGNAPPTIRLCVIRRRSVVVYALRDRLLPVKDVPFAPGASIACLSGSSLCLADSKSYWMVNIDSAEALDLMEISQDPSAVMPPLIAVSDVSEFMLVIWTGHGALGLFMTGSGDPTRGTLEYPQYPLSICVDYPYVVALLPNKTVEIHSMASPSLSIVAVIPCPTTLQPSFLSHSVTTYLVPSLQRHNALKPTYVHLLKPPAISPSEDPTSGSGLTPPPTPAKPPNLDRSTSARSSRNNSNLTRSGTLIAGLVGIHALLPSTLVSQIDSLMEGSRLDDAIELVSQARDRMQRAGGVTDEGSMLEISLIHQRIAFQLLFATRFEDAGKHFLLGDADPRLLIRLFPELRGKMINPEEQIAVYAGISGSVEAFDTLDAIVMRNLVRNYHPHMNIDEAIPTVELRRVLNLTARDMLKRFLKGSGGKLPDMGKVRQIVDTVLFKMFIEDGELEEANVLLRDSTNLIALEIEPVLIQHQTFGLLSALYERAGDEGKVLEICSKLVDGTYSDPTAPNPLQKLVSLLLSSRDRVLVQRYGIWLAKHDASASLKIFTSRDAKRLKLDESLILRALRAADALIGEQYLEHLVIIRRSADATLHSQLALSYLNGLLDDVQDPSVAQMWNDLVTLYRQRPNGLFESSEPFIVYLANNHSNPQGVRHIKLLLFLQGSRIYEVQPCLDRLTSSSHRNLFPLEQAILNAKMDNHRASLLILVRSLKDSSTADAYCTLGGEVIPAKVAVEVGQLLNIAAWAHLMTSNTPSGITVASVDTPISPKRTVTEERKHELLGILMRVYMEGDSDSSQATAQLLNAQAINLDVLDVLHSVPNSWSLKLVSSFVSRSLRRTLHEQQEGQVVKAIAAGQNLTALDHAYGVLHAEGALVEEPLDGETDSGDEAMSEKLYGDDEEQFVSEKLPFEADLEVQPIGIAIPERTAFSPPFNSLDTSSTRY